MIRHNPPGRGHAYRPSLDQRIPVVPLVGDEVEVRAVASREVSPVSVEVVVGSAVTTIAMGVMSTGADTDAGDSHLATAAQAGEDIGDLVAWSASIGAVTEPLRYRIVGEEEVTNWFGLAPAEWRKDGGTISVLGAPARLVEDSVAWLVDGNGVRRARFALRLDAAEAVIGLGERFHAVDQRGGLVDTVVFEQYRGQGARTYLPVPFALVVGGSGWGFFVDSTRRCWFDVGASDRSAIWVEVTVGDQPQVTLHLWEGTPHQVLGEFLDQTGRPEAVPDWALRPWISSNEWNTQERVLSEVRRSLAEGIPVGVVVIEAWSDEGTMTIFRDAVYEPHADGRPHRLDDFAFPPGGAWPDPVGMVDELHRLGVKVLLWQIPVITADAESPQLTADRAVLIDRHFAVAEADGTPYRNRGWWFPHALLPDFTSPQASEWWVEKRRYLVEDVGIDGFKTDGGEHAWGDELRYSDGTRGDETNNRYPNLYAEAYHRLIASTGREGITFSRAGFTGAGRFPAHWAGDEESTWEGFRSSIIAGLTAGVSGVFVWGWDLAGFSGEVPDPELYQRAAAMACFCPIMQYHSEFNHHRLPSRDRTPWNIADRYGAPEVVDTFRRFSRLRERLVPYLSRQLRSSISEARPLMRPLAFDWPNDPDVWRKPLHYMLGSGLLVAPVTEPAAVEWDVYLPAGEWTDVWTGRPAGPGDITVPAPIDRIPVFATAAGWEELSEVFRERH